MAQLQCAFLYVKDLPRMAAFYREGLELESVSESESATWIEFKAGFSTFALHAIPAGIATSIEISVPPAPREETPFKLIFSVGDLGDACARLEALGATILRRPWGSCDVIDPEGNIFQIAPQ